ncbi:MAG: methyl-accepting chemotaxis protein [Erythrobacter sp.]
MVSSNASVQESATTSASARRTIADTTARAADGSQIVAEAVGAMQQIESSSQEINSIIAVIESISFQTNLLALNAGVEAARAGEAGKGFAVVANEVRALAQRCAEAADEVKALISASSVQVSRGVDLVGRSGEAFAGITRDITALSEAIQSIASSAAVQAENLSQITTVVGELDRSTQQNAAMAEECTAAATSLTREAGLLNSALAQLTVGGASGGFSQPALLSRAA